MTDSLVRRLVEAGDLQPDDRAAELLWQAASRVARARYLAAYQRWLDQRNRETPTLGVN